MSIYRTAVAALLAAMLTAGAAAQQRRLLPGHVPAVVNKAAAIGRLPSTTSLNLAIGLRLPDQPGLTRFVQDVSDPASPNYRHYLTPEQFTERFGPTAGDYQAVIAFAKAHNLKVTDTHPDRMLVDVAASVADIEKAFHITLRTYQHPTEARTFYAPDTEPSVEANVPILDISGLNNFQLPHPKISQAHSPHASGHAQPERHRVISSWRPVHRPAISGLPMSLALQSRALVRWSGCWSSTATTPLTLPLTKPGQSAECAVAECAVGRIQRGPTTCPNSGNGEVALDIEMVISMAPGLSKVVVYEAGPYGLPNDILSAMAANTAIKQFSCSWGFGSLTSAERGTMDGYFQKMGTQGQSFFDASGDTGAFIGDWPPPDDDPYITQVGGTALATCATNGAWLSETAWNAPDLPDATAGGYSVNYSIAGSAPWQEGINMSANQGSTTWRNIPDVAMVADDIIIVADDGHQEGTGGTSVATPLWAAFNALVNQQAVAMAATTGRFYQSGHLCPRQVRQVLRVASTTSRRATTVRMGAAPEFFAVPGYDLCTGWGSPAGGSLILALATPDRFVITPGRGFAANGPVGGPFTATTQNLTLTNAGTSSLNWSLSNTSLWLNVSAAGGTLTPGGASATVTVSLNAAANSLAAGVYTANLRLTNTTSGLVQTRQFTLQVGQELVQDGDSKRGILPTGI